MEKRQGGFARRPTKRNRWGSAGAFPEQNITHLHSRFLLAVAERAAQMKDEYGHGPPIAIVFSVSATEALVWEIEHHYSMSAEMWLEDARSRNTPAEVLSRLERHERARRLFASPALERTSFRERLQALAAVVDVPEPDWSRHPLQDLADLTAIRNWLIHIRPERLEPFGTATNRLLKLLKTRRLIEPPGRHARISVLWYLRSPKVTEWAIRTAKATRVYLLDLFPDVDHLK